MRKILLIFSVSLTIIGCGTGGSNQKVNDEREAGIQKVEDTMNIVKRVNKFKLKIDSTKSSLDSLKKDIYQSSIEGGMIKSFYYQSDTLKKEIVYYGETGKRLIHIYQKKGKPVLIQDIYIYYKEPISIETKTEISSKLTNLYYLDEQQNLVYWLKNGQKIPPYKYEEQEKKIIKE